MTEEASTAFAHARSLREGEPPFVLAVDVGSSSVRAAFYDAQAREIEGTQARLERSLDTTAGGGAEADADAFVAEVVTVIDAALVRAPRVLASEVKAVVVSCFWHSLVGTDAEGRAVTPLFGWADTRAAREAEELRRLLDERAAHARTGCPFHPSYWPAKLLWLQREQPEAVRAVQRWMSFGEFLAWRLAAVRPFASVSMLAGTGLFNQRACAWDEELLDDLNERAALRLSIEQLPALAADDRSAYTLSNEYAARWPALRGVPFFAAVADGAANNVGAGCTSREALALMVGTSCAMRVMDEGQPPAGLPPSLWCYRADRRRVLVGGALSDGGGLYEWMRRALGVEADAERLETALEALAPDAHGLTLLPFWAGERSTGWHAAATGAILGLRLHTRPLEILRAAMEAVAYRLARLAVEMSAFAPDAEIRATGGALRASRVWTQIIADALGRPVKLLRVDEASSRGAVILALEALGAIKNIADRPTPAGLCFHPRAAHHARYREAIERQQQFYEKLVGRPTRF